MIFCRARDADGGRFGQIVNPRRITGLGRGGLAPLFELEGMDQLLGAEKCHERAHD